MNVRIFFILSSLFFFAGSGFSQSGIFTFPQTGDTIPANFPYPQIVTMHSPSSGEIYISDFKYLNDKYGTYLMKLDNSGKVLFEKTTSPFGAYDFTRQMNGMYTYFDIHANKYIELDSNFTVVRNFGDTKTDYHEFRIFANGDYILLDTQYIATDLRPFGGDSAAQVIWFNIFEYDKNNTLLFEFMAKDHYRIQDAIHEDLHAKIVDAVHINSIDRDTDGNLIVSARAQNEISKIDAKTGNFIWRWGGNHNQFTFLDNDTFSYPHHIRRIANGNITMFDNGNFRTDGQYSRAVEYAIDEKNLTCKKVWQFRHSPDLYATAMGSVERLADGSTLIGWGFLNNPKDTTALTEIKPDGSTVSLEMTLPADHISYRVYKFQHTDNSVASTKASKRIRLENMYPNPCPQWGTIYFSSDISTTISLILTDELGRERRALYNGVISPGEYSAPLDAHDLPEGNYWCILRSQGYSQSRMIVHIK